ncbi:T9SS C-terminal target domain-containing protein, partial [Candidatus Marinimicrobia bacterium PRS2]
YSNNPYWGWAIGASYITPRNLGDLNGDGGFNVLDIVTLANCILAENCGQGADNWVGSDCGELIENCYGCAGDLNGDGGWNVLDIVTLANCVLANNCGGRIDDASAASLIKKNNMLSIEADGFIGGVQMTLSHGSDFTLKMTDRALFADYLTTGNETRLLVISPETEELFSFTGDFEIVEAIVANSEKEVSVNLPLAASFNLSDAYPNPFNPTTTMTLTMPMAGEITVEVYNLLGQVVATLASGYMEASTYTLTWDASNASSGVYFVQADVHGSAHVQKIVLIK